MSFVVVTPESLQGAAEHLTGLRSLLGDAAASAAGPTTGIAAAAQDEVSVALASMFSDLGHGFQSVNAQAQAFHDQFVAALHGGVSDYLSAEAANVDLFGNLAANLQSLRDAVAANPAPLLRQFVGNEMAYAQSLVTAFQGAVQNQLGYAQLIATSLQHAGNDFVTGLATIPGNLQAAGQTIMAGDVTGGLLQAGGAFLNPLLSGFNVDINADTGLITITAAGSLGDLVPLFGIPGQLAQNFTDLLPTGSIPAMVSQNATNVISTLTDFSQTLDLGTGELHVGLPLALALDAVGPPVTTLNALGSSVSSFFGAVQTGDALGAATSLFNAPAAIVNGFLDGQATLPLTLSVGGLESITLVPLGGLLTPLQVASLDVPLLGATIPLSGTTFGGLLPGLLSFLPEQLALAIGA